MKKTQRKRSKKSKRTPISTAAAEKSSGSCRGSLAFFAGIIFFLYLILFAFTAVLHHTTPTQLFKAAWQRARFTRSMPPQTSSETSADDEALLRMRGSIVVGGASVSDDHAVALPLEDEEDVRNDWARVLDERTNRFYYHHRSDNMVTWDAPSVWLSSSDATLLSSESGSLSDSISSESESIAKTSSAPTTVESTGIKLVSGFSPSSPSTLATMDTMPITMPSSPLSPPPPTTTLPTLPTSSIPTVDRTKCGIDRGLGSLKKFSLKHFETVKSKESSSSSPSSPLWLRVVMLSHGRTNGDDLRPQEDMLRSVRTLMMDAATSGGSPFGDSLGVVVANFAGIGNNPGYEAARKEALREGSDAKVAMGDAAKFDFFESEFDLIGSCGSDSRRDFFGALQIGLGVGPCQNMLLLEAGESLCPSALLMLYYALQKATDYDPTWSSLRVGKGRHGYGGLVIKCSAAAELLKNPAAVGGEVTSSSSAASATSAAAFAATSAGSAAASESSSDEDSANNFLKDLSVWMRKERARTILPLLPGRPLGGAFSYRYRLISENLIGAGCGSAVNIDESNIDLSFHGDAKCAENDISPCAASENDAWLEYKPPNIASVIGSHVTLVIGRPAQSCNDACGGKRQMICLSGSQMKYNLNDCSTLRGRFPCPGGCVSLTSGTGTWPVPSQLVSNTQINGVSIYKGTCIIRQNGPMSMCRATSKCVLFFFFF